MFIINLKFLDTLFTVVYFLAVLFIFIYYPDFLTVINMIIIMGIYLAISLTLSFIRAKKDYNKQDKTDI